MTVKILIVEDNKTIRMIVKKAFQFFDCNIFEAENGAEGLKLAALDRPDLILLDITMPVMDGIEMLDNLKSRPLLKDIPVIMLTAESRQDKVLQMVKMGAREYIVKPFKGKQLVEKARNIVKLGPRKAGDSAEEGAEKYFLRDGNIEILAVPEKINVHITIEIKALLESKIEEMMNSGINRLILDLKKVLRVNVALIRLIMLTFQACRRSNIHVRVVGTPTLSDGLKGFGETSGIPVDLSFEEAKAAF